MEQQTTPNQQEPTIVPDKKAPSISVPYAIITAGLLIAIALFMSKGHGATTTTPQVKDTDTTVTAPAKQITVLPTDYIRGDITKAQVVIVEYSDSDCPYCQRFHATMKEVLQKYGTKVAWVYRYFPLSIHPDAQNEAIALECSAQLGGNDVFWKYLDQLIDITVSPDKSAGILTSTATALGIDQKAFTTCLSNPATVKKVTDQAADAQALGAQGTPYSIAINKKGIQTAIPGAYPIEDMTKTIDGLLK
jgi:protein-disulfide isomerase